ncbi:MAG: hypothetical protein FWD60_04390 [Candidatus Azobacteroides sp.]|nr:hypothetical protein [Candidatus Azobacteroides sp.]
MAQAIVTPTDLRDFATILQKNIDEFSTIENSMNQKLNSYDWKDTVALKFKADFEATKEPLNKLRQQMGEFMPYLTKKADTLEGEYLGNDPNGVSLGALMGGAAILGGTAAVANGANLTNLYYPNVNDNVKNWFKTGFKDSFKDIRFNSKTSLQPEVLERTLNKMYGTGNVKIALTNEGMYLKDGYYKNGVVYLNKDKYATWTNEEKIKSAAHEYYHAYDEKIENQREAPILKELQKEKSELSKRQIYVGSNAYENMQKDKLREAEIDKKIIEIQKNNNYSGISDGCIGVNTPTCNAEEVAYLNSEEEHSARVYGESAAAGFNEFLVERKQERLRIK